MINGKALEMYLHLLVLFSGLCIYKEEKRDGRFFFGGGGEVVALILKVTS